MGEWIPFVRLGAQGITKGELPLSPFCSLPIVATFFLIYPPMTTDLQRCPESAVWFLYVFGNGGKPRGNSCSGALLASTVWLRPGTACSDTAAGAGGPLRLPAAWSLSCSWEMCWTLLVYLEEETEGFPQEAMGNCPLFFIKRSKLQGILQKKYWLYKWIVLCQKICYKLMTCRVKNNSFAYHVSSECNFHMPVTIKIISQQILSECNF